MTALCRVVLSGVGEPVVGTERERSRATVAELR
jgi:hypothetical protein